MNKVLLRQYIIAGSLAASLLLLVMTGLLLSSDRTRVNRADEIQKNFRQIGADVNPAEVWIQSAEVELRQLKHDNEQLQTILHRLEERLATAEQQQRRLLITPAEQKPVPQVVPPAPIVIPEQAMPEQTTDQLPRYAPPSLPPLSDSDYGGVSDIALEDDTVLAVSVLTDTATDNQTAPRQISTYLPAGSFITAVLLTGMDAPTGGNGRSNPVPVLLSLVDSGTLPNRWQHQVQECLVTAAGYGDLAAERAYMRLDRFSCVLINGDTVDLAASGYIVGEDGKAGLRGRVVSKQGVLIARALLSGLAGGIGEGLAQSVTSVGTSAIGSVQNVDSSRLLEYGFARGAGRALDQVARWYLERANEVYPVIEVNSGRQVELVLIEGLQLGADLLRLASKTKQRQ